MLTSSAWVLLLYSGWIWCVDSFKLSGGTSPSLWLLEFEATNAPSPGLMWRKVVIETLYKVVVKLPRGRTYASSTLHPLSQGICSVSRKPKICETPSRTWETKLADATKVMRTEMTRICWWRRMEMYWLMNIRSYKFESLQRSDLDGGGRSVVALKNECKTPCHAQALRHPWIGEYRIPFSRSFWSWSFGIRFRRFRDISNTCM